MDKKRLKELKVFLAAIDTEIQEERVNISSYRMNIAKSEFDIEKLRFERDEAILNYERKA